MTITLEEFKVLLGAAIEYLSEEEVATIYETQHAFANALFEKWLRYRNSCSYKQDSQGAIINEPEMATHS